MKNVLGEIALGEKSDFLIIKSESRDLQRKSARAVREVASEGKIAIDGNFIRLDIATALALRAQTGSVQFRWTAEAAGFIDTFSINYATAGCARRRLRELLDPGVAAQALSGYPRSAQLDPHQLIAVVAMSDPLIQAICLFDEQGLGKTAMTIHAFDRLRMNDPSVSLLVFAPKNMLEEWKNDFKKFMGNNYTVQVITGDRAEKYDSLLMRADVYVTNYETAHTLERVLRSYLISNSGKVVLAIDESFFVKTRGTRRSDAIRRLRFLCDRCWMLCGTPAPNHALDIIHQFDVADGGATFGGMVLPKEAQAVRLAIKERVEQRGVYLRRLKSDVLLDLPAKEFKQVQVPMETEQRKLYRRELESLINDVRSVDEQTFKEHYTTFLGKRIRLLEICSHPSQVFGNYTGVPGKMLALDSLLDELIVRQNEKVVLWSYFRFSLDKLWKRYQRFNPVRLDGSISNTKERSQAVRLFQENNETMLFIGNPAAGGAGITLTSSRITVYESFSVQSAHYFQSLDRIHRRGQTRKTAYYILLCKDSIEESEYARLLVKERYSKELFGEPFSDTSSREVFLDDLVISLRNI